MSVMKNRFITGFICGAVAFGAIGAFAAQYVANDNPFPIQLNGKDIIIEGYNINNETYFKLRDIANAVGGFSVDFQNDTIILTNDGYVSEMPSITLTDSDIEYLSEFALKMPAFNSEDINTENFIHDFILYMHSGTETYDLVSASDYMWSESKIKEEYKDIFGIDMAPYTPAEGSVKYNDGYYIILMGNIGDERTVYSNTIDTFDGVDVVFKHTDSTNSDFGTITCHLKSASNENGYVITSITRNN